MVNFLKNIKKESGMAMIIVLTVAFVVLATISFSAAMILSNLNQAGVKFSKNKVDNNINLALESIRGRYKNNNNFFDGCNLDDCVNHSSGGCVSCSDPNAIYHQGDIKYKIKLGKLISPSANTTGFIDLFVTGFYKNIKKTKTTKICLNYCAASGYNCGANGCGGVCGVCTEPETCGGGGTPGVCGGGENCSDISLECGANCPAGSTCGGGVIIDDKNGIIASPSGCDGSNCSGNDYIHYLWDKHGIFEELGANDFDNGENNMSAFNGDSNYTPAYFCENSSYDYGHGAFDDWYLPAKNELNLIYNAIQAGWLSGFANREYWSSTESEIKPKNEAYSIYFDGNPPINRSKIDDYYVRCLRRIGEPAGTACTIDTECTADCNNGNRCGGGVLIDKDNYIIVSLSGCDGSSCNELDDWVTKGWETGVEWHEFTNAQNTTDGRENMPLLADSRFEAAQFCSTSQYYGFGNWYLPAIDEFTTIYNAISQNWTTGYNTVYWSSTEHAESPDYAWWYDISKGSSFAEPKDNSFYVRCLRRWQ